MCSSIEVAARIPGGQMADLARHAVGVDLVEIALLQALGEEVPDEIARPTVHAAARDPVPHRLAGPAADRDGDRDRRASRRCARSRGSCRPTSISPSGETIRPVQLDGDRRGYVIAIADTNVEALERAEAAAQLVDVVVE